MSNFLGYKQLGSGDLRQSVRLPVRCLARIQIGNRQYAGYLHNLSEGGAKITTFTPVQGAGNVLLRLPDLPHFRGHLRWIEGTTAGVAFSLRFSPEQLAEWAQARLGRRGLGVSTGQPIAPADPVCIPLCHAQS